MQEDITQNFAQGLKALRNQYGWSLQKTADKTGLSKSMLGQIERGESSPTIVTIWKIATGFHLSFSEISQLCIDPNNPNENKAQILEQQGFEAINLLPLDNRTQSEIYQLTLAPGICHLSPAHNADVVEHIVVIKGEIQILSAGKWQTVLAQQCFVVDGHQEHGYRNNNEQPAICHLIMYYGR